MTSFITFVDDKKFPRINFKMQSLFANQTKPHQMVAWICFFFFFFSSSSCIFFRTRSIHFSFYVFINRLNKWKKKSNRAAAQWLYRRAYRVILMLSVWIRDLGPQNSNFNVNIWRFFFFFSKHCMCHDVRSPCVCVFIWAKKAHSTHWMIE